MATDTLANLALAALDTKVAALTAGPTPQGLKREARVRALHIGTSGLGGYIGTNTAPPGSVVARRVSAAVEIEVTGGSTQDAAAHLTQVVRKLLAESRGDLQRDGIMSLTLNPEGDARRATFDVLYEYRHLPTAGEGVIETIDLGISTSTP